MTNVAKQINAAPNRDIEAAVLVLNSLLSTNVRAFRISEEQVLRVFAQDGICKTVGNAEFKKYIIQDARFNMLKAWEHLNGLIVSRLADS